MTPGWFDRLRHRGGTVSSGVGPVADDVLPTWALVFGDDPSNLRGWILPQGPDVSADDAQWCGWVGAKGPALGDRWPRTPVTGDPMRHLFTVAAPPGYAPSGHVGYAIFQGEQCVDPDAIDEWQDEVGPSGGGGPGVFTFLDEIGGTWGVVALTEDLLAAGPAQVVESPLDGAPVARPAADDPDLRAWLRWWATREALTQLWRIPLRGDPNAGVAFHAPDYRPEEGRAFEAAHPWLYAHAGGTVASAQPYGERFGPRYVEIPELPGVMNVAGGYAVLDFDDGTFTWAAD